MSSKSSKKQKNDSKQEKFEQEINEAIIECGGQNNFQAKYFQEMCSCIVGNKQSIYETLQPYIKIKKSKSWNQAMIFVSSYLKRYNMEISLKTMKIEYINSPKPTNYKNTSIIDTAFSNLINFSKDLSKMTFEERVQEFNNQFKQ